MNVLSKREAFQMILDYLFEDKSLKEEIKEKFQSTFEPEECEKPINANKIKDGIIGQLNEKFKKEDKVDIDKSNAHIKTNKFGVKYVYYSYDTKMFRYNTPLGKPSISALNFNELESKVKAKGYPWEIVNLEKYTQSCEGVIPPRGPSRSLNDVYIIPDSYKKYPDIKLNNDGTFSFKTAIRGTKKYDNHILLKIFYLSPSKEEMTVKESKALKKQLAPIDMAIDKRLNLAYGFYKELKNNGGKYCDVVFEIFNNDYEVPFFTEFDSIDDELLINGHKSGISLKKLKVWVKKLNNVFNPTFEIVRIMHDNKNISQKYLFWTLMNFGNDFITEMIKEA